MDIVQLVARIVLAVVFVGMGALHFVPPVARGMRAMIPPGLRGAGVRSPAFLVAFTGVCEIAGGIGLLAPWPLLRVMTALALVVFLIAVFPANVFAAAHREKFGATAVPFGPRFAGQVVLIAVVLLAAVPLGVG